MKTPYQLFPASDLSKVINCLKTSEPLNLDLETCGFYGRIRLVQFYQPHLDAVLMVEWPNPFELAAAINQYQFEMVAHNTHYEISTLQEQTGPSKWCPDRMQDTLLLARLAYPQKEEFTLDAVMEYVLGYDPYARQHLDKKSLQAYNWAAPVLSEEQKLYAATDVYYMPQVLAKVYPLAHDEFSYKLDMLTLRYCADFQRNGMPIDKKRMFETYDTLETEIKELSKNCPVNVNSYKQVGEWLGIEKTGDLELAYIELNADMTKMCYFGKVGTPQNEAAGLVRKLRKLRKQISFINKFEEATVDGNIYGKFKPVARSGRLTSDDQNLQQIPRKLKCCFGVDELRVMVFADYAQIELRHICAIVECKMMEKLFREGKDLHSFTSDMIFGSFDDLFEPAFIAALDTAQERRGELITKEDYAHIREGVEHQVKAIYKRNRQISKTCNFSLLYGGGIAMFISILVKTTNIWLTEVEANRARAKWRNLWQEIYAWQERGIAAWKKGKLGSTPLGRKYSSKMMTDQLNIENQGGAADVNKLALHYLIPRLREYNADNNTTYYIANNIHDSIILIGERIPVHYEAVSVILAEEMQRAWFECSKALRIKDLPMPVDVKVGANWADIENDDVPNIYDFSLEPYKMLEHV